jgi:two-component system LytT family sensor kinase
MKLQPQALHKKSLLMHPVVLVTCFTLFGLLFAAQEWVNMHRAGYNVSPWYTFRSWGAQYFMWGVISWVLWRCFQSFIENASARQMVTIVLPVSLLTCLFEIMIWVALFPSYPKGHSAAPYWARVGWNAKDDLVESLSIFWGAFFLFRTMGYHQQLREKEMAAAQLEAQLANAKIAALRMQLNPHFLFNTMNSISSLMRIDIEAADSLLEQLSSLLRMTLERRDVQLIPLHDEIEFTETYLAMQDCRYAGRVTRRLTVDPDLHDALVPAMILQPIIENAYVHGLSKLDRGGQLSIEVLKDGEWVKALVTNSGLGLGVEPDEQLNGHRVGLANVRNRLRLHYGDGCAFSIREIDRGRVEVAISIPLQLSANAVESLTRYGV